MALHAEPIALRAAPSEGWPANHHGRPGVTLLALRV